MPVDPQNRAQIRDREHRVWDLLLKGLEGVEIAKREGVHPSVISRIKSRVEQRLVQETDGKAAVVRVRQLAEIRRTRREAWLAWEDSRKPAAKTKRRSGATTAGVIEESEVKGQSGNPAFLERICDAIRLEAKLTGTEAPKVQVIDATIQASLAERKDRLRRALSIPSTANRPVEAAIPSAVVPRK